MPGPGDDIARGTARGVAKLNPVTGMMGQAQQGGQDLINFIAQLMQMQQQPQQPPMQGGPQVMPGGVPPPALRQRMLEY